jgi:type II secretory pathway pseudopilin PulG
MTRRVRVRRPAFTLVELLVAMGVIIVLATLALLVVPDVLDKDRTTDATQLTQQWLMISKARAARDKGDRGVRLITGPDPQNPAKTSQTWVTELQYIERPPPYQPNATGSQFLADGSFAPYVVFLMDGSGNMVCEIRNLNNDDFNMIQAFASQSLQLNLPALKISPYILAAPADALAPRTAQPPVNSGGGNTFHMTVTLDPKQMPSSREFGAAGAPPGQPLTPVYVDYSFGIIVPPRPLVGEPPLQLPKNICIDITPRNPTGSPQPVPFNQAPSSPAFAGTDYDILFTPMGHVAPYSAGAAGGTIFLWVRDYTKTPSPLVVQNASPLTLDMTPFQNGGEQQILALQTSSGFIWAAPAMWPTGGQYPANQDWYTLVRNGQ